MKKSGHCPKRVGLQLYYPKYTHGCCSHMRHTPSAWVTSSSQPLTAISPFPLLLEASNGIKVTGIMLNLF